MVFGSRSGGGGSDVDVVGGASSCCWVLVVKLGEEHSVTGFLLAAVRWQGSAGRMV